MCLYFFYLSQKAARLAFLLFWFWVWVVVGVFFPHFTSYTNNWAWLLKNKENKNERKLQNYVSVNAEKWISLSKCILNYGIMKNDCKYCKKSKVSVSSKHTTPWNITFVSQACIKLCRAGLPTCTQVAELSQTYLYHGLCTRPLSTSTLLREAVHQEKKCSIMPVTKTQTLWFFPCFGFHKCCE